jgi:hypothetical protein
VLGVLGTLGTLGTPESLLLVVVFKIVVEIVVVSSISPTSVDVRRLVE